MAIPWGPILGAGASLLGKLFGGGKQETVNRVDYARMVRDAEAAGFNPLTALRNGGAAGFSISTTPAAPLSARLAEGVSAGVNTFLENFDPYADAAREKSFALIDAQIRNLNASSGAIFPPSPSGVSLHNLERRPSGRAAALSVGPLPERFGQSMTPDVVPPEVTNPWPTRWGLKVNPNMPNAEAYEDRYGEFGGSALGTIMNMPGDFIYNAPDLWERGKAVLRDLPPPPLPDWLLYGSSAKRPRLKAR